MTGPQPRNDPGVPLSIDDFIKVVKGLLFVVDVKTLVFVRPPLFIVVSKLIA